MLLRCREMDKKVVESVIEDAKRLYAEKAKVGSPKITIDDKVFLPPPPNPKLPDSHDPHWYTSFSISLSLSLSFFLMEYIDEQ